MHLKNLTLLLLLLLLGLNSCTEQIEKKVRLTNGVDESAGGDSAYIITTPSAIYYLEKEGGGLSSMIDKDGVDWLNNITYAFSSSKMVISGRTLNLTCNK